MPARGRRPRLEGPVSARRRLARSRGGGYKRAAFPGRTRLETREPMAVQRTFSILKPDVTRRNLTGAVNQRIEAAGLRIVAQKRVHMTRAQAEAFYGVHRERPFFGELVEMMTAAPVVVQVLEGEDAIQRYRDVMGRAGNGGGGGRAVLRGERDRGVRGAFARAEPSVKARGS